MSLALDFAAVFWPAHPMKVPFSRLAIFCVLLAGCQTVPVVQKMPPKGDVGDFALVQEFLRATYCPAMTEFKLQIDPDYQSMPGWDHVAFDKELKSGMEIMLKKQCDVFVTLWMQNQDRDPNGDEDTAFFYGLFDRTKGKLNIYQKQPAVFPANLPRIEVRFSNVARGGDTWLSIFGRGLSDPPDQYLGFQLSRESKLFRLRSWGIEIVEPLSRLRWSPSVGQRIG